MKVVAALLPQRDYTFWTSASCPLVSSRRWTRLRIYSRPCFAGTPRGMLRLRSSCHSLPIYIRKKIYSSPLNLCDARHFPIDGQFFKYTTHPDKHDHDTDIRILRCTPHQQQQQKRRLLDFDFPCSKYRCQSALLVLSHANIWFSLATPHVHSQVGQWNSLPCGSCACEAFSSP